MEVLASALTLAGVWLIGDMNVLGQWCMGGAQVSWAVFALLLRRRWMLALNLTLLGLTARAIFAWGEKGG